MTVALSTAGGFQLTVRGDRIADPGVPVKYRALLGPCDVLSGLINAHDHLSLNHYPRLGSPPYQNAYAWGHDLHDRFAEAIRRASALPRREALLFGALKNLLGGVTTVVHHDPWSDELGSSFPIRVARVRVAHSLGFERDLAAAVRGEEATRSRPLSMHLAEGTDSVAAAEVRAALDDGLLDDDLLAVHLVGVSPDDIPLLAAAGTAVVWCPTSNQFLFGRTAPPALFEAGLDTLVGTDSLLTAAGTMLDELRAARRLGYLDDRCLREAVGRAAARRLGLPTPTLAPGHAADVVALRRPLLQAEGADLRLVMVGGLPRLADADLAGLFDYCGVPAEPLMVGGRAKLVAAPLGAVAATVFDLTPECRRVVER